MRKLLRPAACAALVACAASGHAAGEVVSSDTTIGPSHGVTYWDGLTLANSAVITMIGSTQYPSNTYITVGGNPATINGNGEIVFTQFSNTINTTGAALSIGSGVTIRSTTGGHGVVGMLERDIANAGTIAVREGGVLQLRSRTFTNSGVLEASAGELRLDYTTFSNTGTILINGGTFLLRGNTTTAAVGNVQTTGTGTFNIAGQLDNTNATLALNASTGSWRLWNGNVIGGRITASDGAELQLLGGGGLFGVTLAAPVRAWDTGGLGIVDGITLDNGQIILDGQNDGQFTNVVVTGHAPITGVGEIVFAGTADGNNLLRPNESVSSSITIDPGVTVRTGSGGGEIGRPTAALTNHGTIRSQTAGRQILVMASTLANDGTLAATAGGSLTLRADNGFNNNGTMSASAGGTLSSPTGAWSNAGEIAGGGGTLILQGTWTNTGTITAAGGALRLGGFGSNSGTITATAGATVTLSGQSSELGVLSVTDGAVNVGGTYTASQLLGVGLNNSTIALVSGGNVQNAGNTLTIGPAFPLQLKGGRITGGALAAASPAGVDIPSAATVTLDSLAIETPITLQDNATLVLTGAWDNNGVIAADNANITLGGTFTPDRIGTLQRSGGVVRIAGTLDNTGSTFTVDGVGAWQLAGGTIKGGTVAATPGARLTTTFAPTDSVLDGVTLSSDLGVRTGGRLEVKNGMTLANNTVTLDSTTGGAHVIFSGTQALAGTGTIGFDGISVNTSIGPALGGTLTLGPGVTIRTGTGGGRIGSYSLKTINQGLISSRTPLQEIFFAGHITNEGTIEARNGGSILLNSVNPPGASSFTNLNQGALTGGRWAVYAGSSLTISPATAITRNAADVLLSGAGSTFAAIDSLASNTGRFELAEGRDFTTAGFMTNSGTLVVGAGSTFTSKYTLTWSGGTIAGPGAVVAPSAAITADVVRSGGVTRFDAFDIADGKRLDLTDGKLVTRRAAGSAIGGVYDGVQGLVQSGRGDGAWDGGGIVTSMPDADTGLTTLAVATAEDANRAGETFGGVSVTAGDVLVMYTYAGDANLDGAITGDDYSAIDFGILFPGMDGYANGDFNYDGVITGDDYSVIDLNILLQGPQIPAGGAVSASAPSAELASVTAVPEPGACGFALLAAAAVRRRRRSTRRGGTTLVVRISET